MFNWLWTKSNWEFWFIYYLGILNFCSLLTSRILLVRLFKNKKCDLIVLKKNRSSATFTSFTRGFSHRFSLFLIPLIVLFKNFSSIMIFEIKKILRINALWNDCRHKLFEDSCSCCSLIVENFLYFSLRS